MRRSLLVFAALLLFAVRWPLPADAAGQRLCVAQNGAGGCYPTISRAVGASTPGDVISVGPGTYRENFGTPWSLVIQGAGPGVSIIDGQNAGTVVTAFGSQNHLSLSGFTITNGTTGVASSSAGIGISNCLITGNTSSASGGGVFNSSGSVTISDSTISNNTATNDGGAIENEGTLDVYSSALFGNTALGFGGAINTIGNTTIGSSTISGNSAEFGGGIWGPAGLIFSTVTNNTASASTSTGGFDGTGSGFLRASIVAGNHGAQYPDILGSFASGGNNLIGNSTGGSLSGGSGDLLNVNPGLGPLQGGVHPLLAGSRAIDAGGSSCFGIYATDQRGVHRPQGAACDVGAYEYVPPPAPVPQARPSGAIHGSAPASVPSSRPQGSVGSGSPAPIPVRRP